MDGLHKHYGQYDMTEADYEDNAAVKTAKRITTTRAGQCYLKRLTLHVPT
ncbi:hypothetical protein IFU37_023440 (plasmid) [Pantoea agglomerans]|nr:hypothetical protein [Pantoea agglomerans]WVL92396.1 hypothetical protein IFU37_023440 [Pantoea agglomerans]